MPFTEDPFLDPCVYVHTSPDLTLRAAQEGGFYDIFFTFEDTEALHGTGDLPRSHNQSAAE